MDKTLQLNYWKAGEDFRGILDKTPNKDVVLALRQQAAMLRNDADTLEKLAGLIELSSDEKKSQISVFGDTHVITVSGPKDFIAILTRWQLIQ